MLSVFESLKSLVRLRVVVIDNAVFQLHYRWTVVVLLAFSVLVTLKQFWGDAIICTSGHKNNEVVETFCWTETTFTIPSAFYLKIGTEVPYPGIKNSNDDKSDRRHHAYYQWVGLMLFFQAVLFCIPRFIWKSEEGGLLRNLVSGLDAVISKEENNLKTTRLVSYLKASWGTHDKYVATYLLCEVVNFVSVVLQLVFIETFLGGKFSSYGMEILGAKNSPNGPSSILYPGFLVFPRMTKCLFYDFGSSGDPQKYDALCLMPLNVVHEKIYVFLFFWLVALATASGMVIVLRFVSILQFEYREMALSSRAALCPKSVIQKVCQKCSFSDWFFLKLICKNTSPQHCRNIMNAIAEEQNDDGIKRMANSREIIESTF